MSQKAEGHIAAAFRMFLEVSRSDEEVLAYIQAWGDAAKYVFSLDHKPGVAHE